MASTHGTAPYACFRVTQTESSRRLSVLYFTFLASLLTVSCNGPIVQQGAGLSEDDSPVTTLAMSPDGKVLASGHGNGEQLGRIVLWDVTQWKKMRAFAAHSNGVGKLAFAKDGKTLISTPFALTRVSSDANLKVWNLGDQTELCRLWGTNIDMPLLVVQFFPDSKTILHWSPQLRPELWDIRDAAAPKKTVPPFPDWFDKVALSTDGNLLATIPATSVSHFGKTRHGPMKVTLWELITAREVTELQGERLNFSCLAFSPDGQLLAASCDLDKVVQVWNLRRAEEAPTVLECQGVVNYLAFSPDSTHLATCGAVGKVKFWQVKTGTEKTSFQAHQDPSLVNAVIHAVFTSDGKMLITAGPNGQIKRWDVSKVFH